MQTIYEAHTQHTTSVCMETMYVFVVEDRKNTPLSFDIDVLQEDLNLLECVPSLLLPENHQGKLITKYLIFI